MLGGSHDQVHNMNLVDSGTPEEILRPSQDLSEFHTPEAPDSMLPSRFKSLGKVSNETAHIEFAFDAKLQKQVAVKFLQHGRDGKSSLPFEASFRGLHPNIVAILDVVLCDSSVLLVQEYLPGGDLFECFQEQGIFPEFLARLYSSDIICGLCWLHSQDVVHRDIKPENCVLDADGVLKLIDFGLATHVCDGDAPLSDYCGSVEYAAPEILFRQPYNGRAADVWSCGVVMFEMVVGTLPFEEPGPTFDLPVELLDEAGASVELRDVLRVMLCEREEGRATAQDVAQSAWMTANHLISNEDFKLLKGPKVLVKRVFGIMRNQISKDMGFKKFTRVASAPTTASIIH